MKTFFLILSFLVSNEFAYSQASDTISKSRGLSEEDFRKAVDGYLALSKTELYNKHRRDKRILGSKLNGASKDMELLYEESTRKQWFTENLSLTKYQSAEEGLKHFKSIVDMEERIRNENKELFELISKASKEQISIIFKPMRITYDEFVDGE